MAEIDNFRRKDVAQRALELHKKGLDNKTIGLRLGISTDAARIRVKYWKAIEAGMTPQEASDSVNRRAKNV